MPSADAADPAGLFQGSAHDPPRQGQRQPAESGAGHRYPLAVARDGSRLAGLGQLVQQILLTGKDLRKIHETAAHARIEASLEVGQELVPDTVAGEAEVAVARVLEPLETAQTEVVDDRRARRAQHGA